MLIYIIRHGETDLNVKGVLQGWVDEPLNESGMRLARITGEKMVGIRFDGCFSSPLQRAAETARIVLEASGNDLPIQFDDRLREISFGEAEGRRRSTLGEQGRRFFEEPFRYEPFPGGESIEQVCARTQGFLKELLMRDDGKTYLLSTHGCALRAMLNYLYEDPSDFWHMHVPYNCAVSIVEGRNGHGRLIGDDVIYYDRSQIVDRYAK
ncbi:MAG: histidine phosphatase family protein [Clostridia bacterium]|nr:histidine phosphatase family protein [Clostridia bacterium]